MDVERGRRGGGTVSEQGIGIRVEQRLASTQGSGGPISVGIVVSTGRVDSRGVGELVQGGGGLVLGVAGAGQRREIRVVDVAVGDEVAGGESVGEGVGVAVAVGVGAVVGRLAGRLGGGLAGDGAEACGDGVAGAAGGGLEVLLEASRRAGGGSAGSGVGEGSRVAQSRGEGEARLPEQEATFVRRSRSLMAWGTAAAFAASTSISSSFDW